MHDVQLEDNLRRALRAEADSLPFTLTPDELQVRLAARRRASFNHRLAVLAAAGLAVVAVGVGAFMLSRPPDEQVVVPASPTASSSESPASAPASGSPAPTPVPAQSAEPTPPPPPRSSGPIGAGNDAVIVTTAGDPAHPTRIDVSLVTVDAGALESTLQPRLLASFDTNAIPAGFEADQSPPRYSQDGWLAFGIVESASKAKSILIYDLRSPDAASWMIPGDIAAAAWDGGSTLAVAETRQIRLWNADSESSSTVPLPDAVFVGPDGVPQWTDSRDGFLAQSGVDAPFSYGVLGMDGTFTATEIASPALQSTGVERRWNQDWSDTSIGCPTEGGPPGCSVSVVKAGGESTQWYAEDDGLGSIVAVEWDASTYGMWLVVRRPGEGSGTYVVMHAAEPDKWQDRTTFEASPDTNPSFVGLRDAGPTEDLTMFVFADVGGRLAIASGDGVRGSTNGTFVGWAGQQTPYPGLIGP